MVVSIISTMVNIMHIICYEINFSNERVLHSFEVELDKSFDIASCYIYDLARKDAARLHTSELAAISIKFIVKSKK